jgi:Zn finger protein HypA/HybF involved in hydrogenase expression
VPDHWDTKTVNLKVAFASPLAWEHLERLKEIATENGGRCLSEAYVNDTTKLRWECDHGHQWEAVPSSVKQGSWCPECAGTRKKTINEARHAAESRGGECLTKQYIGSKSPMSWKCARGHRWEAPLGRILRGVWCPRCAGRGKTINDLCIAAAQRGGRVLSEDYLGIKKKHRWECSEGHQWAATAESILQGRWCPYCAGQHQTIEDMRAIARGRGGECLSERFLTNSTKLRWRCREGHEWEAVPASIKAGSWCPACCSTKLTIGLMHELAADRGGQCLSIEYVNASTKLLWRCVAGHEWQAAPKHIKGGRWCPTCAHERRGASQRAPNRADEAIAPGVVKSVYPLNMSM